MFFGKKEYYLIVHFGEIEYGVLMDLNVCNGKSSKKDLWLLI